MANQRCKSTPRMLGVALGFGLVVCGLQGAYAAKAPANLSQAQQQDVLRATLKNGLRVVIIRDTLAPMVTTQITYLTGAYETPKGFPGTAHALEHMMFRDSSGMTGAQLDEMAGKMGARLDAFTTNDATQFYFVAPAQYTDMLLRAESIRMRGAELTTKGWDLEKGAIEQEVSRDISSPDFLALQEAEKILYAGTGYAHTPLGSRPTFDKTTSALLKTFYDHWYMPNNAILVVAGDVDPAATLAKVKRFFGPIEPGALPAHAPLHLKPFKPQTISRSTSDPTGSVAYFYRMPGQRSKGYAAMQVLLDVLNNARSPLSDLAAQGKVLSASAGAQPFAYGGLGIIAAGFPKGGNGNRTEVELNGVIEGILKRGVPADLVAAAKRQERAQFEFDKNSASGLASAWSQALAWQGLDSPREALDQIEQVTVQDVNRVAREYLRPDRRVTIVLTPTPNGKRPPNSQGFGGTESFASNAKLDAPLPEWASRQLQKLEMPHWTLDPVTMKLDNGITLIVQPENVSKTITVVGQIDHDDNLQEPKGQKGVGRLLGSLFDYGTTTLDRTAFHQALDKIAASEFGGTTFFVAVPSANFDQAVKLLADNELHPALPKQAFKVQQETLARTLTGLLKSPHYKLIRALDTGLLPAGDPGLRQATPASVDNLDLADAEAYFKQVYRPDMTTIVVVGDVTPAQAKAAIEKAFGAWKATGPKPDVVPKPVPLNPATYTVVPNAYASQDTVVMGQQLDLDAHDPDRYALQLGNEVLGGNGFASRLMVDIRVKHGYAYGANSMLRIDRSRSTFYVSYGSDPDKVQPVDQLVLQNLNKLRDTPVNATELLNAKQALIRSIPLEVSGVNGIARSLLSWNKLGEPLDQPMVAARHYLSLTAGQVQAVFKKYVQPTHLVQVVEGPTPKQR